MNKFMTPLDSSKIYENSDENNDLLFGLKIDKIKNKKHSSNNSKNKFHLSHTSFNSSGIKKINGKEDGKKNISNLTNKLESYCNHKKSFIKDIREKNEEEYILPSTPPRRRP